MTLVLDTHVLLWWLSGDQRLSASSRARLDDDPDIFVSAVSVWEIAIKQAIGKIAGPEDLPALIRASGFLSMPMTFDHAAEVARLPLLHHDPFDRMLIAQTRSEGFTLMTADQQIRAYDVQTLDV